MNTDKKIRFAVVGCGHIGKRHAEMITRDEKAELVALCDIRPKEELGIEAYPVPFAKNLDELLEIASDVDVINICVPNGLHAEMAIKAIEAGHHVVIEKPMALTLADAERVIYTSLRYRKQVFCVMQNLRSGSRRWWIPASWDRFIWFSLIAIGTATSVIINLAVGMEMPVWMVERCLPSSPILSISCIGCLGIFVIFRLVLPISTIRS